MNNVKQLKASQTIDKAFKGKVISKFNAVTHGILRQSVTDYEKEFYANILDDLEQEYTPQGIIEQILIERIAICYLKLFRCQKAETEFMKSKLKPAVIELDVSWNTKQEDGYVPIITDSHVERLLNIYSRYETTIENRLIRAVHELERTQRFRKGEISLQSVAVDVNQMGSFGESDTNHE